MKKLITTTLFAAIIFLTASNTTPTYVYICTGSQSVCYHKTKSCKGLTNCSREIKKITKDEALRMKRRACKICY